jgi:hypothetical protein
MASLTMTQEELNFLITKLKCCSASLSIDIGKNLVNGACDDSIKLILLNSFIKELTSYNLSNPISGEIPESLDTINCLTTEQFAIIVQNAKDICGKCDCTDN